MPHSNLENVPVDNTNKKGNLNLWYIKRIECRAEKAFKAKNVTKTFAR